jgi:hypothetical protein
MSCPPKYRDMQVGVHRLVASEQSRQAQSSSAQPSPIACCATGTVRRTHLSCERHSHSAHYLATRRLSTSTTPGSAWRRTQPSSVSSAGSSTLMTFAACLKTCHRSRARLSSASLIPLRDWLPVTHTPHAGRSRRQPRGGQLHVGAVLRRLGRPKHLLPRLRGGSAVSQAVLPFVGHRNCGPAAGQDAGLQPTSNTTVGRHMRLACLPCACLVQVRRAAHRGPVWHLQGPRLHARPL